MIKPKVSFSTISIFVVFLISLIACSTTNQLPAEKSSITESVPPDKKAVSAKMMNLQIPFIENQGQMADEVRYYAHTFAGNVYVTKKGEIVYSLLKNGGKEKESASKRVVLKENLIGTKINVPQGKDGAVTKINYFRGNNKSKWKNNLPTFNIVNLGEVYDGIELNLKAYGNNVEKLFTVRPSGSVESIKMKFEGARSLRANEKGELEIETELGKIKFTTPYAYQEIDGKRIEVKADYIIAEVRRDGTNLNSYGFQVTSYDKSYPLVIDPLLASTFIGGSDGETGRDISSDSSGNIYVVGNTYSGSFPITPGAYDILIDSIPSGGDVVVSKFDSNLTTLLASTFIGGSANEEGRSIKTDSAGKVFITRWTTSADYPSTPGAYSETKNQFEDNFISCLNTDLSSLLASTFIGGTSSEYSFDLNIDSFDNIYIVGNTFSSDYPTTSGSYDSSLNDDISQTSRGDCFVSKFNNSLSSLLASTFLGGNYQEIAKGVTIDSNGNVFVAGGTTSTDFPTTAGSYDTTANTTDPFIFNVFVSKFDSSLSSLTASTYIGNNCGAYGIGIDSSGSLFISGVAYGGTYPVSVGAYDTTSSSTDTFVSKLNNNLTTLLASTFIGGSSVESCFGLAIDSNDDIFVVGETNSSDFPTTLNAYDETYNAGDDIFVSKLDNNLTTLSASTFIGGSGKESLGSITLGKFENIFIAGYSPSVNYPVTASAYDTSHNGSNDIVISKLSNNLRAGTGEPTAITLSSFKVRQRGKMVIIKWKTASEIDNLGFNILRSDSVDGEYVQLNKKLIPVKKNAVSGGKYKFKDKKVKKGTYYWYKLEDIDSTTGSTIHDAVEVKVKAKSHKKKNKK